MSERKKLGEMGHQPHGINPATGEPEVFCIEFSPEERREFAMRCYEAGAKSRQCNYAPEAKNCEYCEETLLNKFIESEGL